MRKKRVRKSKEGSCLLLFSEYNKSHLNGNKSSEREREREGEWQEIGRKEH
jgi:ribosomal protein L35